MLCATTDRFCPRPEHLCEPMSTCCVYAKRSAQAFDITLDILLTFVSTAEHLLFVLPYVAASIDARLVVTQIIDVRIDHLGRYLHS